MATAVFGLCALTSIACAVLLWRGWHRTGARLLLWTSLGFVGFAANNILLVVDELVVPDRDLEVVRSLSGFAAFAVLVFGLIWDVERDRR
jgi:hydrogenase/urease accessory protein HupE